LRIKSAGAVGVLALVAVALLALPAAGASDDGTVAPNAKFHGKSDNGVYIVRLADLPAVAYDGGVSGLKATKPKQGQKIDPNAPDVSKYVGYLKGKHDDALAGVGGGKKLYDYDFSLNGFAARISEAQAMKLATLEGVISVEPDQEQHADTITTPDFLGLSGATGTWSKLGGVDNAGEGLIIGDIDTGIWPENPEFSDRTGTGPNGQTRKLGYQQIPGWHGKCTPGEDFTASDCNQKLIGAQWFVEGHGTDTVIPEEYLSARDFDGHGSHTASTVAGNNGTQVSGDLPAALKGKASGMAPRARIAAYKACWELPDHSQVSCFTSDTTAAIDRAVADGVDAINFSISGTTTSFLNANEVAWLFAEDAGVFVAASAGNSGSTASTVAHPSPWITTVAASTHNRAFESTLTLGNGQTFTGVSVTEGAGPAPLILASSAGLPGADANLVRQCFSAVPGTTNPVLDPAKVAGKIVVCERGGAAPANARVDKPLAVKNAGGVGTIIANVAVAGLVADIHAAPAIHVEFPALTALNAYAATPNPTASFTTGKPVLSTGVAPIIAGFSSRGPSLASADQLKPDISAPGVDVLAAVAPPNHSGRNWDLESGTSMSSPHVAGLSLLIKQAHPDWTPDVIKSAMMTTAYDLLGSNDPFAQGAGHVNPAKFLDPGLVYRSGGFNAYIGFLCGTGQLVSVQLCTNPIAPNELNLPSMAIGGMPGTQTLHRTVTNVTKDSETYTASVSGLAGLTTAVSPASFTVAPGASQAYSAAFTFSGTAQQLGVYAKGFITLTGDKGHVVRIPVVVRPVAVAAPAEVSQKGTGDLSYGIKTGFVGTLSYGVRGLVPGAQKDLTVPFDPAFNTADPRKTNAPETDITVAAGTKLARFSLFQADTTANDLDLFVYKVAADGKLTLVASSTGPTAEEQVQLVDGGTPSTSIAGDYAVFVDGFDTNGPSAATKLFSWQLGSTAAVPSNMSVTGPTTAGIATPGTVTLHFTGLTSGVRYLGAVDYTPGPINTTLVRVDA
jgi:Subtilase family/Fibronectin type-III domain/Peptidase inhibitor I9/PA domain